MTWSLRYADSGEHPHPEVEYTSSGDCICREALTRRQHVDMRQAAKGAEARDGVAGFRVPDMARLERGGRRIALAGRDERLMSAASSFVCRR
jgi:hypothetical protein